MKTKYFLLVLSFAAVTSSEAQLGNFANKLKNKINTKVNDRVDKKVDRKLEEGLDMAEGKTPATGTEAGSAAGSTTASTGGSGLKSSSKFDFIPGEKIIYTTDFIGEQMGELPLKWNTQGKAELVTLNTNPGNWLRLFPTATYLTNIGGASDPGLDGGLGGRDARPLYLNGLSPNATLFSSAGSTRPSSVVPSA